jgi:hypothetical protein
LAVLVALAAVALADKVELLLVQDQSEQVQTELQTPVVVEVAQDGLETDSAQAAAVALAFVLLVIQAHSKQPEEQYFHLVDLLTIDLLLTVLLLLLLQKQQAEQFLPTVLIGITHLHLTEHSRLLLR